ncbi:hypothetical protein [Nocardioides humi]|uniref:hypothetical protein n=1 Tax=Nocardioides humi TaxID=449461 RepID=UPI001C63F4CB|nr:hypothetical protein [Nocardioides humi]
MKGQVRPNLVTWTLWAAAPMIGFSAQLDSGVGWPAVMTLAAGLGPVLVIATSVICRDHRARVGVFDMGCGIIAVAALAVWLGLGDAPLAVLFAVAADAIAALPTVAKAWRFPESENTVFYVLVAIGASITLMTISSWAPQAWAFAAYQLTICVFLVLLLHLRRAVQRDSVGLV